MLAALGALASVLAALGMKSQLDFYRSTRVLPVVGLAAVGIILLTLAIAATRGRRPALALFLGGGALIAGLAVFAHERGRDLQIRMHEQERALRGAAIGVCGGTPTGTVASARTVLQMISKHGAQGSVVAAGDLPAPRTVAELDLVACRSGYDTSCGRHVTVEIRQAHTAAIVAHRSFPESWPPGCDPLVLAPRVEQIGAPPDEREIEAFVRGVLER